MSSYIFYLLSDLEAAILARWREFPPHYFEMGISEQFLDPPSGYDGPPPGFGLKEDNPPSDLPWQNESEQMDQSSESDQVLENMDIEKSHAEMEQWLDERPPSRQDMYYHFGFEQEQFPPADRLTDADIELLVSAVCRLWAAYNFTPVFPDNIPGRVLYPLLLKRMEEPTFVMTRGNIGVEFCEYEVEHCPFGEQWCRCKEFGE